MYLKSLEISGFKSFAKKGFLDFKASISAIVGPNGSGKSNIVEAFQFVLGEQSIKSMRGKRGEDLIFSGSRNERSLNRASVKIVFDNTSRFLDIDFDEVIIERTVYKDGVNQYFINNSKVRLKDISEILAGANIGSSGHHIISQGEADRILSINSKERRGLIEEALGLRVYQYKIIESEKKLLKVEENLKSVESLLLEIKPHLNFLKKQVKKIELSFELRDNLKDLYKEYFKRETVYLKNKKNYIRENKLPLVDDIKKMDEDLMEAREILKKKNLVSPEENKEILKLEEDLKEVRNKKSNLSREFGQLEGMVIFEQRRIKKEEIRQQESENKLIHFKEVKIFLSDLQNELTNFQDFSVKEIIKKVKDNISDFLSKNSQLDINSENIDGEELKKLNKEKDELNIKLKNILEKERFLSEKYKNLLNNIQKQKDYGQKAEIKLFEIKAKKAEADARLNSLNELEYQINIEDESLKRELNDAYMLAGREATQFFDFKISEENVMGEERQRQVERMKIIEKIKIKLEDMGGGASEEIMKEYKEVKERDEFLRKEIDDLNNSKNSLKGLIEELREKLDNKFKEGMAKINKQFNEFFSLMFGGGKAELILVKILKKKKSDYSDIELLEEEKNQEETSEILYEQEGIDINISLPNKKTKGLQMLSGGERSLTSIALLFAMSQIKPPPFIILDETDAALDEANSRRYGDMIENLSKYSQLILITHNRETMSRASVLYGITMGIDGVSRLLSVKLEEAIKVAK